MLYDPIRSLFLRTRPEEKIRQQFIAKMVGELGFPRSLLAIEKDLASLARLAPAIDPSRRIDILSFAPGKEGLKPLLLVECKALKLDESALAQILGYNHSIGAPFICLTNGTLTQTYWKEKEKMVSISFLPSFDQLIEKL